MKLHGQLVEKLLNLIHNLGGHRDDAKLRKVLSEMDFTPYTRQNGETILVDTQEYLKQLEEVNRANR